MPTDVSVALRHKLETETRTQAKSAVLLGSLIACLANLVLIALSPTFAAAVAALGQY